MVGKIPVNTLLLSLARLSDGNRHALVDLQAAAAAAGLDSEQIVVAAQYLHRKGWAKLELFTGKGYAQITSTGLEEADRLQSPAWRSWARDHVVTVAVAVSVVVNLLVILLRVLFPWLLSTS